MKDRDLNAPRAPSPLDAAGPVIRALRDYATMAETLTRAQESATAWRTRALAAEMAAKGIAGKARRFEDDREYNAGIAEFWTKRAKAWKLAAMRLRAKIREWANWSEVQEVLDGQRTSRQVARIMANGKRADSPEADAALAQSGQALAASERATCSASRRGRPCNGTPWDRDGRCWWCASGEGREEGSDET